MVRIPVVLTLALTLVLGPGVIAAQAQQQGAKDSPVSSNRVSEGLRRPELQLPPLPEEPPIFHVDVTGKLETPLDAIRRELREAAGLPPWKGGTSINPPVGVAPVLAQFDVLPALIGLVTKIKTIRREHAEAQARQMVQQELAAFCATHDCSQVVQEPLEGVIISR